MEIKKEDREDQEKAEIENGQSPPEEESQEETEESPAETGQPPEEESVKSEEAEKSEGEAEEEKKPRTTLPTREQLEQELQRERHKHSYRQALRGTVYVLAVVAAVAVLLSTLMFPVLRIHGTSMTPTVEEGNVIVTLKNATFQRGDIIAFYYNNSILVKRIIALPGEWVNIDEDGNVYVNDVYQEEPYLVEGARAFGECDITLPYQVPDERVFVMGDHRSVSVDSRSTSVGCVAEEQIVGKLVFRLWPSGRFGPVK